MSGLINHKNFDLNDTPSLAGKIALVTGGNAGIGKEMVAQLLIHDISRVYVLAKSQQKFANAIEYWTETHKMTMDDIQNRVRFMACDLTDVVIVKKVAENIKKEVDRLDILIENAGMPTVASYDLSPQGIETIWAANVVGHFTLLNILLPLIEATAEKYGEARIATTSSSLHAGCQELDLDLTMSPKPVKSPDSMDSCWRYCRSKLGVILLTKELSRRLEKKGAMNVYANTFFPGNIPTDAMTTWKELFGPLGVLMKGFFKVMGQSLKDAAATPVYLTTSPRVKEENQKGLYFIPIATVDEPSALAKDKDLARNLWYWCDDKVTKALGEGWQGDGDVNEMGPIVTEGSSSKV